MTDFDWTGRDDSAEAGDTLRVHQWIAACRNAPRAGATVLHGFACEAGVLRNLGRPGAAAGPDAIRRALANLAVHGRAPLLDAGDVVCASDALEEAQRRLSDAVADSLSQGGRPLVLGGGHEVAWASFAGLRQHLDAAGDPGSVLVVNLDAHLDLRAAPRPSSGTPFRQIAADAAARGRRVTYACLGVARPANTAALFQAAEDIGAVLVPDHDLQDAAAGRAVLDRLLAAHDHVYLTIDLDVLPAAVAPGVSAPAALGVPAAVIEALARQVRASGRLRVADIAEMNPALDIDQRTARIAARLAWMLAGLDGAAPVQPA